ncbi:MAG: HAD family hydrolase [Breznakia sp.]
MSKYKGIIFDLDGTLLDTLTDLSNSVNQVLRGNDFPAHSKDDYRQLIGKGFKDLITRSMPDNVNEECVEKGLTQFLEIYNRDYLKETKSYDRIMELLINLQNLDIKLAVNSNKRNDYTNELIKKNFPNIHFIECFGERKDVPKKPDPTSAFELRNLMNLKSEKIIYIGDSKTDIQTAKNANMDSIGVLWGFRDLKELQENGATYIVKTPEEILKIVKG